MPALVAAALLAPPGEAGATEYLCFDSTTQWVLNRPTVTTPLLCVPA